MKFKPKLWLTSFDSKLACFCKRTNRPCLGGSGQPAEREAEVCRRGSWCCCQAKDQDGEQGKLEKFCSYCGEGGGGIQRL